MMTEEGNRSRAHGLPRAMLKKQADSLGIPLMTAATSWSSYEKVLLKAMRTLRHGGITTGVFGDIDLLEHREWVERVCGQTNIASSFPLWNRDRVEVVKEFVRLGFQATLVSVQDGVLSEDLLGERLTESLIQDMLRQGVDPAGEAGEFHTVVTGGPLFSQPISFVVKDRLFRDGYWYLEIAV